MSATYWPISDFLSQIWCLGRRRFVLKMVIYWSNLLFSIEYLHGVYKTTQVEYRTKSLCGIGSVLRTYNVEEMLYYLNLWLRKTTVFYYMLSDPFGLSYGLCRTFIAYMFFVGMRRICSLSRGLFSSLTGFKFALLVA